MKAAFLALLFPLVASTAFAKPSVPKCWTEDQAAAVLDGSFIIGLTPGRLSAAKFLKILDSLRSPDLEAQGFPMIMQGTAYVVTVLSNVSDETGPGSPNRAKLKAAIEAHLQKIVATGAVTSIDCNAIMHINPAVGIRN